MNLGLTFDEKILNSHSKESWLELILTKGVDFIEISPHPSALTLKEYYSIGNKSSNLNIDTHFHVPYFANMLNYTFDSNIINRENIKNSYYDLLEWICSIKNNNSESYLVIHGAPYNNNKQNALDATMSFTDTILNQIIKNNYPIKILYETLAVEDGNAIGDSWEDLYKICKEFDKKHVSICWDICHDLRNHNFKTDHLNSINFDLIPYAHIHGYNKNTKISHVDLSFNKTHFEKTLLQSKKLGFKGLVNLEHLIYACGKDYENLILNDIDWIKTLDL